jgi:serine/threonine protein kinase
MARDAASAANHAHSKGVVHRDIKPANILLPSTFSAVLCDFGVGHDPDLDTLTSIDEKVKSRWFSPPEADEPKAEPTPAWDVFMLGRVVYHALSGGCEYKDDLPRRDESLSAILDRDDLAPVENLVTGMVQGSKERRLQSMGEVLGRIDAITCGQTPPSSNVCLSCREGQYRDCGSVTLPSPTQVLVGPQGRWFQPDQYDLHWLVCERCGHVQTRVGNLEALRPIL